MHNIRNGAIRWQIPDFLSDSNSNFCSISHHLQDIRKNNKIIKCKKSVELENEDQCQGVEEHDLHLLTGNVRIHIGEFFRIIATWQHTFMQKVTHTGMMTTGKICKADLPIPFIDF